VLIDNTNQPDSPINILIVNNDPRALATINTSVQSLTHAHTTCVDSAQKALRVLRQQTIDLLIVDVSIPDLDGWRLSRLVRSGILLCRIDLPIVITAQTWCERIAEVTAREYGINQLLPLEHIGQLPALVKNLTHHKDTTTPKPRLLVVEDEPDTADLIRRILSASFDIEFASEGDAGLRAWVQGRQDLVLLDVMLPKLSGRDILMEIHSIDPNQPVVIMTAHTTIDQAEELMLMGAVDFLPKPFRAEQLRKVCDIAIHRDDYLVSNAQFAARVNAVQEREREYRTLYESHHQLLNDLQSVVMELDADFKIQYLNQAWETMMGFPVSDCIGQSLESFIAVDDFNQYSLFKIKFANPCKATNPTPNLNCA
jgi:DNA-binding response OmpR family regulator